MKKKKEVIIIISAVLFAIALFVRMTQNLQLILMLVAYILLGKDTVLKAVKNVEKGDFFDENFLMTVATLGAIMIGEYPEAVAVMLFYEVGELFQGRPACPAGGSVAAHCRPQTISRRHPPRVGRIAGRRRTAVEQPET